MAAEAPDTPELLATFGPLRAYQAGQRVDTTVDPDRLRAHGVAAVYPLTDLEPDPARSMARAAELLETTAERIAADRLRSRSERTP